MYKNFWKDRRGNFAIMFTFVTIPMLGAIGMAMEYSNITNQRAKLQNAADAAILFAGQRLLATDMLPPKYEVEGFIESNFEGSFAIEKFEQRSDGLILAVDTEIPSYFFGQVYPSAFDQSVSATIPYGGKSYAEIAMVLDSTGSMLGFMDDETKMDVLKKVANNFIDRLSKARDIRNEIKIGLVPFTNYVNIGEDNKFAYWVEEMEDPDSWSPCVGSRPIPHTLKDGLTHEPVDGVMTLIKFPAAVVDSRDAKCPAPIVELTDSTVGLKRGIAAMEPWGGTYIGEGVAWGQRVLSKAAPLTEGKAFGDLGADVRHRKYMLVLTDGDNVVGPSFPKHQAAGVIGREYTRTACQNAKAAGITIFTIAFGTSVSGAGKNLMLQCATDAKGYFEAEDANALKRVFDEILTHVVALRLSS